MQRAASEGGRHVREAGLLVAQQLGRDVLGRSDERLGSSCAHTHSHSRTCSHARRREWWCLAAETADTAAAAAAAAVPLRSTPSSLAVPKSTNFMWPPLPMRMFSGLTSRCATPCTMCMNSHALTISATQNRVHVNDRQPCCAEALVLVSVGAGEGEGARARGGFDVRYLLDLIEELAVGAELEHEVCARPRPHCRPVG